MVRTVATTAEVAHRALLGIVIITLCHKHHHGTAFCCPVAPYPMGAPLTTTPVTPITLLQAVNELLQSVGIADVTTLSPTDTDETVQKAVSTINDFSTQVQSLGWHFNSEIEYPLVPSPTDGTITLPANFVSCNRARWPTPLRSRLMPPGDRDRYFTIRYNDATGQAQLYDIVNHTFAWILNANGPQPLQPLVTGTLVVEAMLLFPFSDCPQPIRWLIMSKAGRAFAVGRSPDQNTFRFTDTTYEDALASAMIFDQDSRARDTWENPHYSLMRRR